MRNLQPGLLIGYGLVLAIPAVVSLLLLRLVMNAGLFDYVPAWSDEIFYWKQIQVFSEVGLNGGYFTLDEFPAAAPFSRFYAHGLAFPAVFGTIARVTGWHFYTMPVLNLLLLTGALAFFLAVTRPALSQTIWVGILVAACLPVYFYSVSTMQESVHQAAGIVCAACFYRLLQNRDSGVFRFGFGLFLAFISLLRPTWSLLFVPFFVLKLEPVTRKGLAMALIKSAIPISVFFYLFQYWGAPYVYGPIRQFLVTVRTESLMAGIGYWLNFIRYNLVWLVQDRLVPFAQRLVFFVVFALALLPYLKRSRRIFRRFMPLTPQSQRERYFHLLNLGLILVLNVVIYELGEWRDYRVLAPHLLLSLLVYLLANEKKSLIKLAVVAQILVLPVFISDYRAFYTDHFTVEQPLLAEMRQVSETYLHYDAAAENGWCNTVLVRGWHPRWLEINPKMGFSVLLSPHTNPLLPQSKYLIIDEPVYTILADRGVHLEHLADLSLQTKLYLNHDADCGTS